MELSKKERIIISSIKFNKNVSTKTAIAIIVTTILLIVSAGLFIGYKFFWNAYDKDDFAEHNLKAAKQRVSASPTDIGALVALGSEYAKSGNTEEALKQFQKALRLDPVNNVVRYNIALIKIQKGDYSGARVDLETLKAENPKYWEARNALGSLLLELKEYKLAAQELEIVNTFEPGRVDVLFNLGQAYLKMGDKNKARIIFNQALKYNPTDEQVKKALSELE